MDVETKLKEERRLIAIGYKQKVKDLIELCQVKLPGTTYDKFWVESIIKRYSSTETIQPILNFLQTCESKADFDEFMADL